MKTFSERIYEKLKKVPKGKVITYKELAGGSRAYRAVGRAMKENKDIINIPCFKVVKSSGEVGNYSRGVREKIRKLKDDGVVVVNGRVDLEKYGYSF